MQKPFGFPSYVLFAMTLGLATSSLALSQTSDGLHGQVYGDIGWSGVFQTNDVFPTVLADSESSFGGGLELRPFVHFGGEFNMSRMSRNEKTAAGKVFSTGSAVFATASFVYHPFNGPVQPFLFVGGGTDRRNETLLVPTGSSSARVVTTGGGAEFHLLTPLVIRAEARMLAPKGLGRVLRVSAGLAYTW